MTEEKLYPYRKPEPGSLDVRSLMSLMYMQVELDEVFGVEELSRVFVHRLDDALSIYSFSRGNLDRAATLVHSLSLNKTQYISKFIIESKRAHKTYTNDINVYASTLIAEEGTVKFDGWMQLTPKAMNTFGLGYGMIPLFSSVPPPFRASDHVMEVMGIVVKLGLHETYDTWRYVYNRPTVAGVVFPIRSTASFKLSTKWKDASIVDQAECIYWMNKLLDDRHYCEVRASDDRNTQRIFAYIDKLSPEVEKALEGFLPFDDVVVFREDPNDDLTDEEWVEALRDELKLDHRVVVGLDSDTYGHTEGPQQVVVSTLDPEWDICEPTVYFYTPSRAPQGSVFHERDVNRMIALLLVFENLADKDCVIREGPNSRTRLEKWKSDEEARRRLVDHLVSTPHVLVDMPNEPMVPWKGMKFFHGTDFEDLQTRDVVVPRENVPGTHFMVGDKVESDSNADIYYHGFVREIHTHASELVLTETLMSKKRFTVRMSGTKITVPAWQVGHRAKDWGTVTKVDYVTRTLRVGPDTTLFMDFAIRETSKEPIPECNLSWKTIYHGTTNQRTGAREDLHLSAFTTPYFTKALNYGPKIYTYRLLKDGKALKMLDLRNDYAFYSHKTEIDAFRVVSELSGIPHIARKYRTEQARELWQLFQGLGIDGAILNTDVEWIWFQPSEVLRWEEPSSPATLTWQLLNGSRVNGGETRNKKLLVDLLVKEDGWRITPDMVTNLLMFLPGRVIPLSEISHLRWSLDNNPSPYVNQYSAFSRSVAPAWRPVELRTNKKKAQVFDISYAALWAAFSEKEDNERYRDLYMAAAVTEGSCNHLLPYNRLLGSIKVLNETRLKEAVDFYPIHLRVRLPTGVIQIVPPFTLEEEDYMSLPRQLTRLSQPQEEESKMDTSVEEEVRKASKRKQETELERSDKNPRLQARMRW